jgi:hypothetical protein
MSRLSHAWRELESVQRLAALTAGGLFVSMFLPWYSKTDTVVVKEAARATQTSLSAFEAFSFVEAAVLLVSAGVLAMLFSRAEGHEFQLPGGDGTIVMVAGGWAAVLIFFRLLDKPGLQGNQRITATVGVQWGIFIALLLALGLLYAVRRMRAEGRPQPPLLRGRGRHQPREPRGGGDPGSGPFEEAPTVRRRPTGGDAEARERLTAPVPARAAPAPTPDVRKPSPGRPRFPPAPAEQMSFEDPPPAEE